MMGRADLAAIVGDGGIASPPSAAVLSPPAGHAAQQPVAAVDQPMFAKRPAHAAPPAAMPPCGGVRCAPPRLSFQRRIEAPIGDAAQRTGRTISSSVLRGLLTPSRRTHRLGARDHHPTAPRTTAAAMREKGDTRVVGQRMRQPRSEADERGATQYRQPDRLVDLVGLESGQPLRRIRDGPASSTARGEEGDQHGDQPVQNRDGGVTGWARHRGGSSATQQIGAAPPPGSPQLAAAAAPGQRPARKQPGEPGGG